MTIGKLLKALLIPLFSLSLFGCVEAERIRVYIDHERDSNSRKRCFDCDTTQLIGETQIEIATREVRELDQSCELAEDCILVSLDIVCEKSLISIADDQAEAYAAIVDAYFEQNPETHYCSTDWSPRFDVNNYESQCVQNQCRAVYLGSLN